MLWGKWSNKIRLLESSGLCHFYPTIFFCVSFVCFCVLFFLEE